MSGSIGSFVRVACFSNHLGSARSYGIGRYATELVNALTMVDESLEVVPVSAWADGASAGPALAARLRVLPLGRRATSLAWTFVGRPWLDALLREPVDVVHDLSVGYPMATRRPLVATVHDIGPLTHPEYFSNVRTFVFERSLRRFVQQADTIICDSHATKDEVDTWARARCNTLLGERSVVVYPGVSTLGAGAPDAHIDALGDHPFVLTAGKLSPRKNVDGVISALGAIRGEIPHHLVVVGGDGWDMETIRSAAARAGIADRVHFAGFVSDAALGSLYRSASVYVHPSFFEGFGLTVLEAMAAGCPVITSNRSSLPEVAGDAALLVDPSDSAAIANAIRAVCADGATSSVLRERGVQRAATFTWSATAAATASIYRRVA